MAKMITQTQAIVKCLRLDLLTAAKLLGALLEPEKAELARFCARRLGKKLMPY